MSLSHFKCVLISVPFTFFYSILTENTAVNTITQECKHELTLFSSSNNGLKRPLHFLYCDTSQMSVGSAKVKL